MLKFLQTVLLTVMISILKRPKFAEETYDINDIESLMASITTEGVITSPIIDENNDVLSGNRVVEACRRLGWKEIQVRKVEGLSDLEKKKLIIEANKQRVKSPLEIIRETEFYLSLNPPHQGKKVPEQPTTTGIVETDSEPVQGAAPIQDVAPAKDRYDAAAIAVGARMSGPTLRRLMHVKQFEQDYPDNGLKLLSRVDRGEMSINEAYGISKKYVPAINEADDNVHIPVPRIESLIDNFIVYQKSCEFMSELQSRSIPLSITSIPYYDVRTYGLDKAKRQGLGLEPTVEEFIENMTRILKEIYRVLTVEGSLFLNIGDTYNAKKSYEVPERILMAALSVGFFSVNRIIWKKRNMLPQTCKRRLQPSYEIIYHLVIDRKKYYYKALKFNAPEKKITVSKISRRNKSGGWDHGKFNLSKPYQKFKDFIDEQECANIIYSSTAGADNAKLHKLNPSVDHPAIFPEVLPVIPILSCSKPSQKILDPFGGSGTTAAVALMLGRKAVMYETEERFVKLAEQRLEQVAKIVSVDDWAHFQSMVESNNTIDVTDFADNDGESVAA